MWIKPDKKYVVLFYANEVLASITISDFDIASKNLKSLAESVKAGEEVEKSNHKYRFSFKLTNQVISTDKGE